MRNVERGRYGEAMAERYLINQGYIFVERNYRTRGSEIDLIFIDPIKRQKKEILAEIAAGNIKKELKKPLIKELQNTLVFVEVKTRTSKAFGEPFEAVGQTKQRHLMLGANKFIKENGIENASIRFDIVSILGDEVQHIKNVF